MRPLLKALPALLLAVLAAILIGCGGGGGGGGSSTNGSTSTTATNSTTATTSTTATNGITSIQAEAYDTATNTVVGNTVKKGDTLQLRLFGRDSNNNISYPSGSVAWTINASSGATVSSSGLLSVTGNSGTFTVTGNGQYSQTFTIVSNGGGGVTGRVRLQTADIGVPGAIIEGFNTSKTKLASAITGSNGTFRLLASSSAQFFDVNFANIDSRYVNVWSYGSGTFSPDICKAIVPLPSFTEGQMVALTRPILLYQISDEVPVAPDCELP